MVSFGLKVTWLVLCWIGTVISWFVLWAFARSVGSFWGPMTFLAAVTLLQGSFGIGIIYRMDPFLMPKSFCLAQLALVNFFAFVLAGVCAAFTYATTVSVLWPSQMDTSAYSTLKWRRIYALPIYIFPVCATSLLMGMVVKFDAAKPADGLHCDVTGPLWVRLLGYAGMPVLEAFPCAILAILAGVRIGRMHKSHRRASRQDLSPEKISNLTPLPPRSRARVSPFAKSRISGPMSTHSPSKSPAFLEPSAAAVSSSNHQVRGREPLAIDLKSPQFHLNHHSPTMLDTHTPASPQECYVPPSPSSSTFPTFAPISDTASKRSISPCTTPLAQAIRKGPLYDEADDDDVADSWRWSRDHSSSLQELESVEPEDDEYRNPQYSESSAHGQTEKSQDQIQTQRFEGCSLLTPSLMSAIWRLILFQSFFGLLIALLTLSTLIDIIRGTYSPFGTQHVALLLSAYSPIIVFSHSPGVVKHLKFWRR